MSHPSLMLWQVLGDEWYFRWAENEGLRDAAGIWVLLSYLFAPLFESGVVSNVFYCWSLANGCKWDDVSCHFHPFPAWQNTCPEQSSRDQEAMASGRFYTCSACERCLAACPGQLSFFAQTKDMRACVWIMVQNPKQLACLESNNLDQFGSSKLYLTLNIPNQCLSNCHPWHF